MVGNEAWVARVKVWIERDFPNLSNTGYEITSPDTIDYNCIAWAAEDNERWWWPDSQNIDYWPAGVPREVTIDAFIQAYQTIGYEVCDRPNLEPGFQKIAIYADSAAKPTHASRQLPDGKWTSKLGQDEDIQHETLEGLTGENYGNVACIMRKDIECPTQQSYSRSVPMVRLQIKCDRPRDLVQPTTKPTSNNKSQQTMPFCSATALYKPMERRCE